MFNHESPLRGEEFVTKKITLAVAKIKYGLQKTLYLGNLNARRDWGDAKDYVKGMWQILQAEKPDNYVLATGTNETIRNFAVLALRLEYFLAVTSVWLRLSQCHGGLQKTMYIRRSLSQLENSAIRINFLRRVTLAVIYSPNILPDS